MGRKKANEDTTMMTTDDASELHRPCDMLGQAHDGLAENSPLREAVTKAALGLSFAYANGGRSAVEAGAQDIGAPLDKTQLERLRSLGLETQDLQ
jgi:hypothetical protein